MTHLAPRPELEPPPTERTPVSPLVGWCSLCGECVLAGQGHAFFPGAKEPLLLCVECVARHEDWHAPLPQYDLGGEA